MKKKRLGEVLRERGQISARDLNQAIQDQQGKLVHLGELMLERRLVAKEDLVAALSEVSHIPYVDCATVSPDAATIKLVPADVERRCCILPVQVQGNQLIVAMAEPQNLQIIDELRFKTGKEIVPRLGFRAELVSAIQKCYGSPASDLLSYSLALDSIPEARIRLGPPR